MKRLLKINFPGLLDILGVVFLFAVLFQGEQFLGDPGLGWHLRTGQWIMDQGQVPKSDIFLLGLQDKPWVHNQWLSDVVLWLVYEVGGFPLLHLVVAGVCLSVFFIVLLPLWKRMCASNIGLFAVVALAAVIGSIQWFVRPVIFSFLLFALVYRMFCFWYDTKAPRKDLWRVFLAIPVIFALWANLHPAFAVGLGLLCAFCAALAFEALFGATEKRAQKRQDFFISAVILLFSVMLTLIGPYGVGLYRETVVLLGSSYFMELNKEWYPPEPLNAAYWPFFFSVILVFAAFVQGGWRKIRVFDALVLAGLLVAALLQRRYLPFWAMVMPAPVFLMTRGELSSARDGILKRICLSLNRAASSCFGQVCSARSFCVCTVSVWMGLVLYVLIFSRFPFCSQQYPRFPDSLPKSAVEVIAKESRGSDCSAFLHPDLGGFLAFSTYPRRCVFIDDRNTVVGEQRYRDFFRALREESVWNRLLNTYGFRWALLSKSTPLAVRLLGDPSWELLDQAAQEEAVVLFRRR